MDKDTLEDLGEILSDLMDRYAEAIAAGARHIDLKSAVGAPFHERVQRCHAAVFEAIIGDAKVWVLSKNCTDTGDLSTEVIAVYREETEARQRAASLNAEAGTGYEWTVEAFTLTHPTKGTST